VGEAGDVQVDDFVILAATKSFWLQPANWWAILQVLIGLGAVIFVHELGHFLLAKACGVKCDKFYVGFDVPIRLFGRTIIPGKLVSWKWGETEYGIGSIPLGGYVKMLGQDDNPGNLEENVKESLAQGAEADAAILASGLVDRSKLDPRSFLAKTVLQRMLIISAGVIFNLIFGVFFAAWAFKTGVDYEPPVIGNVIGGGPAWENDLTGAEIMSINGKKIEGYFTRADLFQEIVFNGDEKKLILEVKRYGEATTTFAEMTPRTGFLRLNPDLPLIGVSPRSKPVIGDLGAIEGSAAAQADPPFMAGDRVLKVDNLTIETDIDLRRALEIYADKDVTFVLERKKKNEDDPTKTVTTTVPKNPMRIFGFSVEWLPVASIKMGSPAAKASLQIGDDILTINGTPRGDLMTVDRRMIQAVNQNQSVTLGIKRDGQTLEIEITPEVPKLISDIGPNLPIAIDSLGVTIPTNLVVESVEPGSPAEQAGLKNGDSLKSVEYVLSESQKEDDAYAGFIRRPTVNFDSDTTSWPEVSDLMQGFEVGTKLKFTIDRDSVEQTVEVTSVASSQYFQGKRGITLTFMQKHYKSETWSEALLYGRRQVWNDGQRVIKTLAKLIKGKISPKNLGGPGTIAMAATSEATRSTSRLLLFLTFLSANLAVVNFLPIPILDGGHMVFLAYEGIFRRPVSERVQIVLTYGGLFMILALMLFVIFLDIGRIASL
jgi:regulator of sigma E protease